MPSPQEIEAQLTGPGGPFEIVDEQVLGERMRVFRARLASLREMLSASAAHGDKEYLVYGERRITFAQHLDQVAHLARALRERYGVRAGDRVAILAANCPEWILAFWATTSLGAVLAGLNGWWAEDEIRYGIDDSEPRVLIGDRRRLARLGSGDPGVPVIEVESDFEKLIRADAPVDLPDEPINEDDAACILYTSGTTGRPKGAVLAHRAILGCVQLQTLNAVRGMMVAAAAGLRPSAPPRPPCQLLTTPLFHVSGLFTGAAMMLSAGARLVLRGGRFDAEDVMRLIEREQVTSWTAMGPMAHRVLEHPRREDYDLSSLTNLGSGGAPMSDELQQQLRETFPTAGTNMGLGYGLTESGALATIAFGAELAAHPKSVGRPLPTIEVEIRDPAGQRLPEGRGGEIYVRSPILMREYWRKPEATREAILPGRWLRTGDFGRLEDGRLYINARARDLILRGAENIYPVEIEHRLEAHPAVAEAAVVGVEHRELGQEVKAIVVPRAGQPPSEDALARWVGEKLASFKVPAHWELRDEPLPRNAAGKVMKQVLLGESDNPFIDE